MLNDVVRQGTLASQQCPSSETIAYVRLRAAELTEVLTKPAGARAGVVDAEQTAARFPKSVRIATVAARVEQDTESAEYALSIDPSYTPARVALASALLKKGMPDKARAALETVKDLNRTSDGYSVLASARLEAGDAAGAAQSAKFALTNREALAIEPDAGDPRPAVIAHTVLGIAMIKLGKYEDAARHLLDASSQSEEARNILKQGDPKLKAALVELRRSGKLTTQQRKALRQL